VPAEAVAQTEGLEMLEPGMTLSLAAGVYDDERVGCRFEELVAITETGNRVLSRSPYYGKELMYTGGRHG
jgi:Xaa-Pro aminopeptidase